VTGKEGDKEKNIQRGKDQVYGRAVPKFCPYYGVPLGTSRKGNQKGGLEKVWVDRGSGEKKFREESRAFKLPGSA